MMKNAFYFTLKSLLAFQIFKFQFWHFGHVEIWLNQKDQLNYKVYDITIAVHILSNISRRKGNKAMKFGQLIEEIFFMKHTQNMVKKLFPDRFLKIQN